MPKKGGKKKNDDDGFSKEMDDAALASLVQDAPARGKKGKKKAAKPEEDDDPFAEHLAATGLDVNLDKVVEEAPKGKKGKKKAAQAEEEDDPFAEHAALTGVDPNEGAAPAVDMDAWLAENAGDEDPAAAAAAQDKKAAKNAAKKAKKKAAKQAAKEQEQEEAKKEEQEGPDLSKLSAAARKALERRQQMEAIEKQRKEEEARIKAEEERIRKEEEEQRAQLEAERERKRLERREKKAAKKQDGPQLSAAQRAARDALLAQNEELRKKLEERGEETKKPVSQAALYASRKPKQPKQPKPPGDGTAKLQDEAASSEEESGSDDKAEWEEELEEQAEQRASDAEDEEEKSEEEESGSEESDSVELRAPVIVIMGHVDTGKTKLLDKIRGTNVQGNEAQGITQQIGATFFPEDAVEAQCVKVDPNFELEVPGMIVIDTPGHEAFSNLRQRGSRLCDIAILVVDIMHGLESQTIESLQLLKEQRVNFVVALNKCDRIYGWVAGDYRSIRESMKEQPEHVRAEFQKRANNVILEFAEKASLNTGIYWELLEQNKVRDHVAIVPTSAITGEGVPDLIYQVINFAQVYTWENLEITDDLEATVLEMKTIEGLGMTMDVIITDGELHQGDTIVFMTPDGAKSTEVKALVTPKPLRELRVAADFNRHRAIRASMGVKIVAKGLEGAIAGTTIYRVDDDDDEEEVLRTCEEENEENTLEIDTDETGVYVMASTRGSLEALVEFLRKEKVPVFATSIGKVYKKDVARAKLMIDKGFPQHACVLAFDVKPDAEAVAYAEKEKVRIFCEDTIYILRDKYIAYRKEWVEQRKKEMAGKAVFPAILKILPKAVFRRKDPVIIGVRVEQGTLRMNTPLCVPDRKDAEGNFVEVGIVTGLEVDKKPVQEVRKGTDVCVKIEKPQGAAGADFGRHWDEKNTLFTNISRKSIDTLKEFFREEMSKEDWELLASMKALFTGKNGL